MTALSLLTAAAEYLLPSGSMKRAAGLGAGLVFMCYVIRRVIGIFDGLGG